MLGYLFLSWLSGCCESCAVYSSRQLSARTSSYSLLKPTSWLKRERELSQVLQGEAAGLIWWKGGAIHRVDAASQSVYNLGPFLLKLSRRKSANLSIRFLGGVRPTARSRAITVKDGGGRRDIGRRSESELRSPDL